MRFHIGSVPDHFLACWSLESSVGSCQSASRDFKKSLLPAENIEEEEEKIPQNHNLSTDISFVQIKQNITNSRISEV